MVVGVVRGAGVKEVIICAAGATALGVKGLWSLWPMVDRGQGKVRKRPQHNGKLSSAWRTRPGSTHRIAPSHPTMSISGHQGASGADLARLPRLLHASTPPPAVCHRPVPRDHIAREAQPQAPFGEQSYSLAFPENLCLNTRARRCSSYPRLNGVDRRGCSYTSRTLPNAMAHRTSSRCKWRYAKFCFAAVRIPCQLKLVEESLQNESGGVIPGSYRVTRGAVYVCTAVLLFRINS